MASAASKRNRQARTGRVSYKDSSEDDEDFSVLKPRQPQGMDTARRNLALRRVSRSQERDEALRIQQAIEASLSEHNAQDSDVHARGAAVFSDEGFNISRDAPEIECLDSGTSNARGRMVLCCDEKDLSKGHPEAIEMKITRADSDNDVGSSSNDEDASDEDSQDDASDYAISDVSEDSRYKRKKTSAIVRKVDQIPTALVKKARSIRPISKMTSTVVSSESGKNKSMTKDKGTVKIMKTASLTTKSQGSTEAQKEGSSKEFLYGSVSDSLQSKSPTFIHRRIIGLSRRFRPPPLHPYLSHMQS